MLYENSNKKVVRKPSTQKNPKKYKINKNKTKTIILAILASIIVGTKIGFDVQKANSLPPDAFIIQNQEKTSLGFINVDTDLKNSLTGYLDTYQELSFEKQEALADIYLAFDKKYTSSKFLMSSIPHDSYMKFTSDLIDKNFISSYIDAYGYDQEKDLNLFLFNSTEFPELSDKLSPDDVSEFIKKSIPLTSNLPSEFENPLVVSSISLALKDQSIETIVHNYIAVINFLSIETSYKSKKIDYYTELILKSILSSDKETMKKEITILKEKIDINKDYVKCADSIDFKTYFDQHKYDFLTLLYLERYNSLSTSFGKIPLSNGELASFASIAPNKLKCLTKSLEGVKMEQQSAQKLFAASSKDYSSTQFLRDESNPFSTEDFKDWIAYRIKEDENLLKNIKNFLDMSPEMQKNCLVGLEKSISEKEIEMKKNAYAIEGPQNIDLSPDR